MYLFGNLLYFGKWVAFWFLLKLQRVETGGPAFPLFFVIGMEALSCLIDKAVEGGFLFGYRFGGRGREGLIISHLLYADDTILFYEPKQDQIVYLNWLLMWFEAILMLKGNFSKSEIIPLGREDNVEALALEIRCKIGVLPSSYLGLPLGAHHNSMVVWDNIEERFQKKQTLWKRQYISKGERLTLLRSTLSSLPIYYMSLFRLPRRVKLRLK